MRVVKFFTLILFLAIFSACQKSQSDLPKIILWAWERPENLEFIDTKKFGVAFLAQTLELIGDEVKLIPRRQPLNVPDGTYLIAVTRIEIPKKSSYFVALSEPQRQEILRLVLETLKLKNVSAIQIDFDVTVSEREFYRQLLQDLRPKLPKNIVLNMTALASWCIGDNWIKDLPVDEAIPMAFDMGADDKTIRDFLASGEDWSEPLCRKSYGISVNQPLKVDFKPDRRFYVFTSNPNGWKKSDLENLKAF
jgi:hypothetical protein